MPTSGLPLRRADPAVSAAGATALLLVRGESNLAVAGLESDFCFPVPGRLCGQPLRRSVARASRSLGRSQSLLVDSHHSSTGRPSIMDDFPRCRWWVFVRVSAAGSQPPEGVFDARISETAAAART